MSHNVVHFAIHADDVERARRFYAAVFGWHFEAWGPPNFYRIHTGPPHDPGIEGALHERHEPLDGRGVRAFECTVAVDDLAATRSAVVAHGGTVRTSDIEIPGIGTLFQFLDTEGNVLCAMRYFTAPTAGSR